MDWLSHGRVHVGLAFPGPSRALSPSLLESILRPPAAVATMGLATRMDRGKPTSDDFGWGEPGNELMSKYMVVSDSRKETLIEALAGEPPANMIGRDAPTLRSHFGSSATRRVSYRTL